MKREKKEEERKEERCGCCNLFPLQSVDSVNREMRMKERERDALNVSFLSSIEALSLVLKGK